MRSIDDFELATKLAQIRWPEGMHCPRCDSNRMCHLRSRPRVFECLACHKQTSVTAGTLLHGTRLPLQVWLVAAVLELRPEGMSTAELARTAELAYDTAWHVKQRLQAAMASGSEQWLDSFVDAAHGMINTVRNPRDPRKSFLGFAVFKAPDDGLHALPLGGMMCQVREALRRLRPPSGADLHRPALGLVRSVTQRIRLVHHGVSELWFHAYLNASATADRWRATDNPTLHALEALLTRPRQTFATLRPPRPPHWPRAVRPAPPRG